MTVSGWLFFLIISLISFVPLTRYKLFTVNKRYRQFFILSGLIFLWTIVNFLRFIMPGSNAQYYLALSVYPLVFAITIQLYIAFMSYIEKPIRKIVYISLIVLLALDALASFTNIFHELMLVLPDNQNVTYESFNNATHGIFFFIHTAFCYFILLFSIIRILNKLYVNLREERDILPFTLMIFGVIIGTGLNVIHVFFYTFYLDPTYVAFVILISLQYFIFYIRDIRLILELNRNHFILDNLREMYLIVNQRNEVVGASNELIKTFSIPKNKSLNLEEIFSFIDKQAYVYDDPRNISHIKAGERIYLHMLKKEIKIPFLKHNGIFYLFYDETSNQKYIRDMNYIRTHDLMTDLYNRNYFEEVRSRLDNSKNVYTLVMFDLDGLKNINDILGHNEGDEYLKDFASRLREIADDNYYIPIRMGGDEFLLICLNKNKASITQRLKSFCAMNPNDEREIIFSYGVAERERDDELLETVFNRADDLMYEMKNSNIELKNSMKQKLIDSIK